MTNEAAKEWLEDYAADLGYDDIDQMCYEVEDSNQYEPFKAWENFLINILINFEHR